MSHEIYVFGSAVRGEVTRSSDTDILVLPLIGQSRDEYPSAWSYYTMDSIGELYKLGRLFAWHLYLESVCIYTPANEPFVKRIGPPADYTTAHSDIVELKYLLETSLWELSSGTPSHVYEIGLVYTCLRDIGMSASWRLLGAPCFSRNAPLMLDLEFPISEETYLHAMAARHAGTRGTSSQGDWEALAMQLYSANIPEWVNKILGLIS